MLWASNWPIIVYYVLLLHWRVLNLVGCRKETSSTFADQLAEEEHVLKTHYMYWIAATSQRFICFSMYVFNTKLQALGTKKRKVQST